MKNSALTLCLLLMSSALFAQTATYTTNFTSQNCQTMKICTVFNHDGGHSGEGSFVDWNVGSGNYMQFSYESNSGITLFGTTAFYEDATTFSVSATGTSQYDQTPITISVAGTWHTGSCYRGVCQHLGTGSTQVKASTETLHALGVPGY